MVAVLSWVAMSKKMSVEGAGADKMTVKVAVVVPLFPSATLTSSMVRFGGVPGVQLFTGALLLRGKGPDTRKSAALSSVSVHPPALRKSEVVFDGAAAAPLPS